MKRGFYSGVIAGLFAGLYLFVNVVLSFVILAELPEVTSLDFWLDYLVFQLGIHSIFGGIFGLMYSKFYVGIPGKGVKKGLVFALILGLLSSIFPTTDRFYYYLITGLEIYRIWGLGWLQASLKWIPYGIVLGFVYERLKL